MKLALLQRIKETIIQIEPSAEIFLYGSRAREDFHDRSDWDLLILVEGEVDVVRTDRIRHELFTIELDSGEILSSIVRSRQDWNSTRYKVIPLHENVEQEGILL